MNKRLLLANALRISGAGIIGRHTGLSRLVVFNYHRIKPEKHYINTPFDDGVFGPSQLELYRQLSWLKKNSNVLSEEDLVKAFNSNGCLKKQGPFSLITFDDAYIDNYELAMPIIKMLRIPAIFFVPYMLIEKRQLGWWDLISYMIKRTNLPAIVLYGETIILGKHKHEAIRKLNDKMKLKPVHATETMIDDLSNACEVEFPDFELMDKELMSWRQIIEASDLGITIGSHTCRHLVLSTMDETRQSEEISQSKTLIEKKIGRSVSSLAYPVGGPEHFNQTTMCLAKKSGYQMAFSFNTGVGNLNQIERFAIPRIYSPINFSAFRSMFLFPQIMDYGSSIRWSF